jgi:hypothetical protein
MSLKNGGFGQKYVCGSSDIASQNPAATTIDWVAPQLQQFSSLFEY